METTNNAAENSESPKVHPFVRTLGQGPYTFVGYFYIDKDAGAKGRPYYDASLVHKNFVRGAGTCAHCGQGILNIFQIQTGNGEVYGVGSDCIAKVGLPYRELTKVQLAEKAHQKKLRDARKAVKREAAAKARGEANAAAMEEFTALMQSGDLAKYPHPNEYLRGQGKTLQDYANFCVNGGNVATMLDKIKKLISGVSNA